MTRIAIVGARRHRALAQVLRRARELHDGAVVVSGARSNGVDAVAEIAARQRGLELSLHPAQWTREDGSVTMGAGKMRNGDVVLDADEVEAWPWPGCSGTWDTVRKAKAAGKPMRIHEPDLQHQALLVFSARVTYKGPGSFCVMRFGGGPEAEPFAPTEELLKPALVARDRAKALQKEGAALRSPQAGLFDTAEKRTTKEARAASLEAQAEEIDAALWAAYEPQFRAEMAISSGRLVPGTERWLRLKPAARQLAEEAWTR